MNHKKNTKYFDTTIYKICCKDENIKDVYVGHTTNFYERKQAHELSCNNENNKLKIYEFIRQNGGWNNWQMIELAKYYCKNKTEARIKENEYFNKLKPTLNSSRPYAYSEILYCDFCDHQSKTQKEHDHHLGTKIHHMALIMNDLIKDHLKTNYAKKNKKIKTDKMLIENDGKTEILPIENNNETEILPIENDDKTETIKNNDEIETIKNNNESEILPIVNDDKTEILPIENDDKTETIKNNDEIETIKNNNENKIETIKNNDETKKIPIKNNKNDDEETAFYCRLCEYSTNKKSNFNRHLTSLKHKNLEKKFKNNYYCCNFCNVDFETKSGLWKHIKNKHSYIYM